MKIAHLGTFDIEGGAARAAYRIHKGIESTNICSNLLVRYKKSSDKNVIQLPPNILTKPYNFILEKFEKFETKKYNIVQNTQWSPATINNFKLVDYINNSNYDIINLHWINMGYLSIFDISKINKPIVWTLHDMWPFTGGCHYAGDCIKFESICNSCFQLNSNNKKDLSYKKFKQKTKNFNKIKRVVAPSNWIRKNAMKSPIFENIKIDLIPYGIDTNIYCPKNKIFSRQKFKLSIEKKLILFPGFPDINNKRKGFYLLIESLIILNKNGINLGSVELVVLGKMPLENDLKLPLKVNYIDRLNDDNELASLYSACDFSICASTEDNLPNTVIESLACGLPVIGFDIGGVPDMIENDKNGYIIPPFDILAFSKAIEILIYNHEVINKFSNNARIGAIEKYDSKVCTDNYINLYSEILDI